MYCNAARGGPSHCHKRSAQKIREDRSSGSRDMLADRQAHTDRQTDRNTPLQYRGGVKTQNAHIKPKPKRVSKTTALVHL